MRTPSSSEIAYRAFLQFKNEFVDEALKRAVYTNTDSSGDKYRPVVIIDISELPEITQKINIWNSFAEKLSKKESIPVNNTILLPLPQVITGVSKFHIFAQEATSVSNIDREALLTRIKGKLNGLARRDAIDSEHALSLQEDIHRISQYPDGTMFRLRRGGYMDAIVNATYAPSHGLPAREEIVRISRHGLFITNEVLSGGYTIEPGMTKGKKKVYDYVDPIPCSLFMSAKIYLLDDVEKTAAELKEVRKSRKKQQVREASARYRQKLKMQADTDNKS